MLTLLNVSDHCYYYLDKIIMHSKQSNHAICIRHTHIWQKDIYDKKSTHGSLHSPKRLS